MILISGTMRYLQWFFTLYVLQWRSQKAEKLRTSKGDYLIKQWFSSIAYFLIWELLLKDFFPLRAVPYGMINNVYHIGWPPLNVAIFNTLMRNCVIVATPMFYCKKKQNQ